MLTLPLTTGSPYHDDRVRERSKDRDIAKANSLDRINVSPRSPPDREIDQQKQVADLFAAMRETSLQLATLKRNNSSNSSLTSMGRHSPHSGCSNDSLSIDLNNLTQSYEVLYVGRMKVSSKKAPPTFIDDALEKLKLHELDKMIRKRQGGDHDSDVGSQDSVDEESSRLIPVESVLSLNYAADSSREEDQMSHPLEDDLSKDQPYLRTQSCAVALPSHNNNQVEERPKFGLGVEQNQEAENRKNKTQSLVTNILRRPRSASSDGNNRTMLLQVGKSELSLISPEKKSPLLQKQFKDVVYCAQGQKNNEHFGFICKELHLETYVAYIFRCQCDSVAEYILTALKQSSQQAQETRQKEKQQKMITSCSSCPSVWFSKLVAEVEGVNPSRAHVTIMRRLEDLPDHDRASIIAKLQGAETTSAMEENDLLMMLIKAQSEMRQQTHVHDIEHKDGGTLERALFTTKKSFAKLSDILKRKETRETSPSSDDFPMRPHLPPPTPPEPEVTRRGGSPPLATLKREGSVGSNDNSELPPSGAHRPRSSTLGTSGGDSMKREFLRKRKNSQQQQQQQQQQHKTNTMLNLFMKMGSQNKLHVEEPETNTPMRRSSFRKAIFHHVNTPPSKGNMSEVLKTGHPSTPQAEKSSRFQKTRPTKELMVLWKRYIFRQMVLQRIEREIRRLKAIQHETEQKRMKLEYEDVCHVPDSINTEWEILLTREDRTSHRLDPAHLADMVKQGVYKKKRGEIWKLLAEQHRLNEGNLSTEDFRDYYTPYEDFLKELTDQHHAILVDLSRTFPNHPYYQKTFGPGQLALFNLLKAYSLLDAEVGYCQGLSFIAGILLLHTSEVDAFDLLKHIMFALSFRRQYKPDMAALQEQMYQLSRILHDGNRDLYEHLEKNDIAPSLYAAPWFLTCFASQFPIGFVVRVFDLIMLQGLDAIFKVALVLLRTHKDGLLKCDGFEEIMDYLKSTMPALSPDQANLVIRQASTLGISRQLHAYEVEYNVIKDEMQCTPQKTDPDILQKLENNNRSLRRLNMELLEKLQKAHTHEANASHYKSMMHKLENKHRALEKEHAALKESIDEFITSMPEDVLLTMQIPINCRKMVCDVMQRLDSQENREVSPTNSWKIGSAGSSFESNDSPPLFKETTTHDKHVRFQVDYDDDDDEDDDDDDVDVPDFLTRQLTKKYQGRKNGPVVPDIGVRPHMPKMYQGGIDETERCENLNRPQVLKKWQESRDDTEVFESLARPQIVKKNQGRKEDTEAAEIITPQISKGYQSGWENTELAENIMKPQIPRTCQGNRENTEVSEILTRMPEGSRNDMETMDLVTRPESVKRSQGIRDDSEVPEVGSRLHMSRMYQGSRHNTELSDLVTQPQFAKMLQGTGNNTSVTEVAPGPQIPKMSQGSRKNADVSEVVTRPQMPKFSQGSRENAEGSDVMARPQVPKMFQGTWDNAVVSETTARPQLAKMPQGNRENTDVSEIVTKPQMPKKLQGTRDSTNVSEAMTRPQIPKLSQGSRENTEVSEVSNRPQLPKMFQGNRNTTEVSEIMGKPQIAKKPQLSRDDSEGVTKFQIPKNIQGNSNNAEVSDIVPKSQPATKYKGTGDKGRNIITRIRD